MNIKNTLKYKLKTFIDFPLANWILFLYCCIDFIGNTYLYCSCRFVGLCSRKKIVCCYLLQVVVVIHFKLLIPVKVVLYLGNLLFKNGHIVYIIYIIILRSCPAAAFLLYIKKNKSTNDYLHNILLFFVLEQSNLYLSYSLIILISLLFILNSI